MDLVHKYKPHTDWVCVTSDNKYVVSGSDDKTIRITRLETKKKTITFIHKTFFFISQ